jgi:hypothetical protein
MDQRWMINSDLIDFFADDKLEREDENETNPLGNWQIHLR